MLTEREKILIKNLVDEYISTGEAISSEKILVNFDKIKFLIVDYKNKKKDLKNKGQKRLFK